MAPDSEPAGSPARISRRRVDELRDLVIPVGAKGVPLDTHGMTVRQLSATGRHVLRGEFPMPVAVLRESQVNRNITAMQSYCDTRGVSLCPHGKTTLAPQLFQRQIEAGAWGVTAATPAHLRMYRHFGVSRILYANQLVEPGPIRWLAAELSNDPDFEFYCLVDSVAGVEILSDGLREARCRRPVDVLVEIGHPGARCGVRDMSQALDVARAVDASDMVTLVGVECFEGLPPMTADLPSVDEFLCTTAVLATEMMTHTSLADRGSVILTAGGSAYFDRVVDALTERQSFPVPVHVVLRSGCYVTQDGGFYAETSPLQGRATTPTLANALELWAAVLSRPEPDFLVTSLGKRDCSYDQRPPVPRWRFDGQRVTDLTGAETVALSDQHAHLRVPPDDRTRVGDLVGFVVSHPCTTFDKWSLLPVVDDDHRMVDIVVTAF